MHVAISDIHSLIENFKNIFFFKYAKPRAKICNLACLVKPRQVYTNHGYRVKFGTVLEISGLNKKLT